MKLILDKDFSIRSDKMNFVLERISEIKDRETGEVKFQPKDVGYYGNLDHLLNRYLQEKIRDSESESVGDLLEELLLVKLYIKDVVKKENITLDDFKNDSL